MRKYLTTTIKLTCCVPFKYARAFFGTKYEIEQVQHIPRMPNTSYNNSNEYIF